ncbi:MAG: choloylglycine hydrolase [Clostridia bacterium]|nr:choloylglycine hydrolase [Clostridia bacterium]
MCTVISVVAGEHYFGRNLDYEHTFGEQVVIVPRRYPFTFTDDKLCSEHYAMIGMALPMKGYPLYFDAVNERGLGMAGLNFPGNAHYIAPEKVKRNIASYEFIPRVLAQCANVEEAETMLSDCCITDVCFSDEMKYSPLHWFMADKHRSVTIEQTEKGFMIYDNPVGVLTNNPTFDMQLFNLNNYHSVTSAEPQNIFSDKVNLATYSRGMGGLGLPGDLSSMSRFVKAAFTKLNSVFGETEEEKIHQFFHCLYSVYQQKGCVQVGHDFEMTNYSSCCNADKGIYYFTTYYNSSIRSVSMHHEDLYSNELIAFDLQDKGRILSLN